MLLSLEHHPNSPIPQLHRILPQPLLVCHDSILSRSGACALLGEVQITLHPQHPVLPTEPGQLLLLSRSQPFPFPLVDIGLGHPPTQPRLRDPKILGNLSHRLQALTGQLHSTSPKLRRLRSRHSSSILGALRHQTVRVRRSGGGSMDIDIDAQLRLKVSDVSSDGTEVIVGNRTVAAPVGAEPFLRAARLQQLAEGAARSDRLLIRNGRAIGYRALRDAVDSAATECGVLLTSGLLTRQR